MDFMKYFGWYLAAVNIVAFIMYGIDKEKARRGAWRIPESTLIGVAFWVQFRCMGRNALFPPQDKKEEIFCRNTADPCCGIWTGCMAYDEH